jgi:hypothetical protein
MGNIVPTPTANHQLRSRLARSARARSLGSSANLSAVTALAGNRCNPDYGFYQVGSRTQWNPVPRLDIGRDITYPKPLWRGRH